MSGGCEGGAVCGRRGVGGRRRAVRCWSVSGCCALGVVCGERGVGGRPRVARWGKRAGSASEYHQGIPITRGFKGDGDDVHL